MIGAKGESQRREGAKVWKSKTMSLPYNTFNLQLET